MTAEQEILSLLREINAKLTTLFPKSDKIVEAAAGINPGCNLARKRKVKK